MTTPGRLRLLPASALLALLGVLTACGGGSDEGGSSGTPPTVISSASQAAPASSSTSSSHSSSLNSSVVSSVSSQTSTLGSSSSTSSASSMTSVSSLLSVSSSARSSTRSSAVSSSSVSSRSSSTTQSSSLAATVTFTYEAEEANIFKGRIETEHTGFSGTGYVNYDNANDSYVEWNISLNEAASVELGFHYANGTDTGRPMAIRINGDLVTSSLTFDPTGAWNNWLIQNLVATLPAGNNTIRATSTNTMGGPNVDRLTITGNVGVGVGSSSSSSLTPGSSSSSSMMSSISSASSLSSISSLSSTSSISSVSSSRQSSSSLSSRASSSSVSSSISPQEVRAFPGAEGFAAMVTGGRGGRVIKVTNLNPSGTGSLREALQATGPRIVVFDVSGTIRIPGQGGKYGGIIYANGNLTIAGQTAPGGGITLEGRLYFANTSNIIVRHLRVRPEYDGSNSNQFDAIQMYDTSRVMLDHVSASFGADETIDAYTAQDVTVQWSTIESAHNVGDNHNYGLLSGQDGHRISVLNSLFAHNFRRNPAISNGPADVINNVMYNVRHGFHHDDPSLSNSNAGQFNIAGNYFKAGPSTSTLIPIWFWKENGDIPSSYYAQGNWTDTSAGNSQCPSGAMTNPRCSNTENNQYRNVTLSNTFYNFSNHTGWRAPVIKSAQDAYTQVIAKVGAFPRDVVTRRTITEMQAGTGAWGSRRDGLNMMDGLTPGTALPDSDGDGMPDVWEAERTHLGLSPHIADHNTLMPSGYTAIEEYINERADALLP